MTGLRYQPFDPNAPLKQAFMVADDMLRQGIQGITDLINITGGEPTLHPELMAVLAECRRPEIGRITMNSNGIRFAEDASLCRRLAAPAHAARTKGT